MTQISRRALAKYAVDQLTQGSPASEVAKKLASVLVDSGRVGEAESLIGDIDWELEKRGQLAIVRVTSAAPLSQALEKALQEQIKKAVGVKQVTLKKQVDKSVIGGLRAETATRVWDKTIKRRLAGLREVF